MVEVIQKKGLRLGVKMKSQRAQFVVYSRKWYKLIGRNSVMGCVDKKSRGQSG